MAIAAHLVERHLREVHLRRAVASTPRAVLVPLLAVLLMFSAVKVWRHS